MAKSKKKDIKKSEEQLHPDTKKSIWIVAFLGIAIIFILSAIQQAGPVGNWIYSVFHKLFGWGYYILPALAFIAALSFASGERKKFISTTLIGSLLFLISGLGLIDIIYPGKGGLTGNLIGTLEIPFGQPASLLITFTILIASFLTTVNRPLRLPRLKKTDPSLSTSDQIMEETEIISSKVEKIEDDEDEEYEDEEHEEEIEKNEDAQIETKSKIKKIKNYIPPPLSLLTTKIEKPTIGDLQASANIIKRTLESFGVPIEMGEINVGPTVTRFTLKPAEGVKLSRITALNQDLALALAAHPIRIEAPIPGKSLIGIEVPNKAAALVRLGSMLAYPEFKKSNPLTFVLGRNVSGEPVIADIAKMPHLLIAGATGSGKSVMIHSLITSLLYKNSPEMLGLILIDPKRVELSIYNDLPHLVAPVITENKKAIAVLRWAIQEMEDRYEILLKAGVRDIQSYNKRSNNQMSYLLIVIDELADLMSTFGREVEGVIVRLAQMSRATGIHLVVSTQRPSVEIITGLIKANITSRIALQVPSLVDSRTILDASGAEKLLGNGDLLFISAEFSKPCRIQGAYLSESEVKKVINFIKENNKVEDEESDKGIDLEVSDESNKKQFPFEDFTHQDTDDELYDQAVEIVRIAKKASSSLLQRRLKIGYARAARILDIMEERGVVGPGEGAKPREIYEI